MDKPVFRPGTKVEWVGVVVEGNQIMAAMGPDVVQGFTGFGKTIPEALRHLANDLEKRNWRSPIVDLEADPPHKSIHVVPKSDTDLR